MQASAARQPRDLRCALWRHDWLGCCWVSQSPMGIWRVAQRLGQAAVHHTDGLSLYHADSRSIGAPTQVAPWDRSIGRGWLQLGNASTFQTASARSAKHCRRYHQSRKGVSAKSRRVFRCCPASEWKPPPGRRSAVRRFPVTCLGDADAIFTRLYAQLRELGWVGAHPVVVIVGDGSEWIWNRATMFVRRCEILDSWHAWNTPGNLLSSATGKARHKPTAGFMRSPRISASAGREGARGHRQTEACAAENTGVNARACKPSSAVNAGRMCYDEYLRLGYGIGSGAVEPGRTGISPSC